MIEKIVCLGLSLVLLGLIHYRNFYHKKNRALQ